MRSWLFWSRIEARLPKLLIALGEVEIERGLMDGKDD